LNYQISIIENNLQNKIYTIRDTQVMVDSDLAELYGVETKRINEAVKNNPDKFPDDFLFELSKEEFENLKSKFSTSSWGGRRKIPKVFTEQGVYMLATIVKSKFATQTTITIMRTFTKIKHLLVTNQNIFNRVEIIEKRQIIHEEVIDKKINILFKALEDKKTAPTQGIFYNSQIFDAYNFINNLLRNAEQEIIIIDNFIDDTVLTLFSKYPNINFTIITKFISKQLKLDIDKYNAQYKNLIVQRSAKYHDRFLLIDNKEAYHIGASLKDLGKKVFAFSKIDRALVINGLS